MEDEPVRLVLSRDEALVLFELLARYDFKSVMTADDWSLTVLSWFRFVGLPTVALILVLVVQAKSNRGLRMALGEDELLNEMIRQA